MGKVTHGKWAKYTRMYKLEWEEDPQLRGWVAPVEGIRSKAWCLICRTKLRAHKTDLMKHASSQKHKENISLYGLEEIPALPDEGVLPSEMVVQVVREPGVDPSCQDPLSAQLYATVEDHVDSGNQNLQSKDEPCIITVVPAQGGNMPPGSEGAQASQEGQQKWQSSSTQKIRKYIGPGFPKGTTLVLGRRSDLSQKKNPDPSALLLVVEKERLAIERARLAIEKERLKVEKERLAQERERLTMKRQQAAARGYPTYMLEGPNIVEHPSSKSA